MKIFYKFLSPLIVFIFVYGCSSTLTTEDAAVVLDVRNLVQTGKYKEALTKAKQLIATRGDTLPVLTYNMADCYIQLSEYDKAIAILKKVDKDAKHYNEAYHFFYFSKIYFAMESYNKAIEYSEKGVKELPDVEKAASSEIAAPLYKILAESYRYLGKYNKAEEFYRKASKHEQTYNNIRLSLLKSTDKLLSQSLAAINYLQGNYQQAATTYQKILARMEEEEHASMVRNFKSAKYSIGLPDRSGNSQHVSYDLCLKIGASYFHDKNYKMAAAYFNRVRLIIEKIRNMVEGKKKRDYFSKEIQSYEFLTATFVKQQKYAKALFSIELSRSRELAEIIGNIKSTVQIPHAADIQKEMSASNAILLYANTDIANTYYKDPDISNIQMVVTSDAIFARKNNNYIRPGSVGKYTGAINAALRQHRGLVRKKQTSLQLKSKKTLEEVILYYRKLLSSPDSNKITLKELAQILYKALIAPLQQHLNGKKELIIVADGILNFLPFETLIDENGKYLVEKYVIKYIPSLAVRKSIDKRNYKHFRKPVLALGGAIYDTTSYASDMIDNEIQMATIKNNILQTIAQRGSLKKSYQDLGIANWSNLPGTLQEVNNIAKIIPQTKLLTGTKVSEEHIKKMSQNGELQKYKVLHFATHGLTLTEFPELSALVLSQKESGKEDGYLRMKEIANLQLKADFVNLSACETGLGKIYKGEGVVGLARAFLIAGANGVSVSLWSVDDISTMVFMSGVYQLVKEQNLSYLEAMTTMKRTFILGTGDSGQIKSHFTHPYYWAPFIYYGR